MSRSTTLKYVLEIVTLSDNEGRTRPTPMEWKKYYGAPTATNIAEWVFGFEQSCGSGGCNQHLGEQVVLSARIRENRTCGKVVATWERKSETVNFSAC